jgi:hypothetical protein
MAEIIAKQTNKAGRKIWEIKPFLFRFA